MTTPRRAVLGAATLALAAAMLVLLGSPSQAEPRKLLVGTADAGPFQDQLSQPLFHGQGPFVPRDRATSTFWVKNNSPQPARATVAVVDRGTSNAFERALTFDVTVGGVRSTSALPDSKEDGCRLATTGPTIEPRGVQPVAVALLVDDLAGQVGTAETSSLDFVVTLTQVGKADVVDVCGAQAAAQPEVKGAQTSQEGGPCSRDVVVTALGTTTCVPTAVDAGTAGTPGRDAGLVSLVALVMIGLGALVLLWGAVRREDEDETRRPSSTAARELAARE